jgi:hypothetical protein
MGKFKLLLDAKRQTLIQKINSAFLIFTREFKMVSKSKMVLKIKKSNFCCQMAYFQNQPVSMKKSFLQFVCLTSVHEKPAEFANSKSKMSA